MELLLLWAALLWALLATAHCGGEAAPPPLPPSPTPASPSSEEESATSPTPLATTTTPALPSDRGADVVPSLQDGKVRDDEVRDDKVREYWRRVEQAVIDGSAERQGLVVEGDVLRTPPALAAAPRPRNAEANRNRLWPNKQMVLELAPGEWSSAHQALLRQALADIERESCVRFVWRTNQTDYVLLRHVGKSCNSAVGYRAGAGAVPTFLGASCMRKGTIQHEILHSLGFWHEHTRPDRDEHVTVQWDNIRPGSASNFSKRPPWSVHTLGLPYDYASVLHYRANAFSKDRQPTLVPKDRQALPIMGQRKRFSPLDIAKLNSLYGCS